MGGCRRRGDHRVARRGRPAGDRAGARGRHPGVGQLRLPGRRAVLRPRRPVLGVRAPRRDRPGLGRGAGSGQDHAGHAPTGAVGDGRAVRQLRTHPVLPVVRGLRGELPRRPVRDLRAVHRGPPGHLAARDLVGRAGLRRRHRRRAARRRGGLHGHGRPPGQSAGLVLRAHERRGAWPGQRRAGRPADPRPRHPVVGHVDRGLDRHRLSADRVPPQPRLGRLRDRVPRPPWPHRRPPRRGLPLPRLLQPVHPDRRDHAGRAQHRPERQPRRPPAAQPGEVGGGRGGRLRLHRRRGRALPDADAPPSSRREELGST